ncbi:MAG: lipoyl(octanoyl) transferase LipB [Saprospiraceae bacterium]
MTQNNILYKDIGRVGYDEGLRQQYEFHDKIVDIKLKNKNNPEGSRMQTQSALLFCEHNPVYTLGKSGKINNLIFSEDVLVQKGIEFKNTNRGGDITYHGPGQIVGYPIFDLDYFYHDVHRYVRDIEEVIILTLQNYGLEGMRIKGATGVWLKDSEVEQYRKVCAIGIHISRWVTLHGFAFNINTDLDYFSGIIPCGIQDKNKSVTSISKELGLKIEMDEVKELLLKNFEKVFDVTIFE